jgi:TonB-linked SusC/RagA family outer membrane protein
MFKYSFIVVIFFLLTVTISAQTVLRGKVFDNKDKETLIGAAVEVVGKKIGTVTNSDGNYELTIIEKDPTKIRLEISYLGYKSKLIKLANLSPLKIYLDAQSNELTEVVVTSSYGTKKSREDLVGSLTVVKAADLQVNQAIESVDKMLDGIAAGVIITSGSQIGAPVKIDIRGQGSLTPLNNNLIGSSTQPLIIVDGIVMGEETGFDDPIFDGNGALSESFKNPLSKISPEDIESITILKDASAVGLYGADAANGVILIKTKRSTSKKLNISAFTQYGRSSSINRIKYLTGPEFYDLKKEFRLNFGDSPANAAIAAGSNTINTDWFDLTNQDGSFSRYGLNMSTGFGNFSLRASFTLLNNQEPQIENSFKRYGGSLAVGYVTKKISSQLTFTPSYINQNSPNTLFSFALPSNISAFNEDRSYANTGYNGIGNPIAIAKQNLDQSKTLGGLMSWNFAYYFTPNFKISNIVGVDYSDKEQQSYRNASNESGHFNGTFIATLPDNTTASFPNWGRRLDSYRNLFRWNQSVQLLYEKKINKNSFDGIVGFELQRENAEARSVLGTGFVDPFVLNEARLAKFSFRDNNISSESARRSVIGQVNYNFDKKYFLTVNLRRDESSSFGSDIDPALNGGIGLSWNASNENMFKNVQWLDLLKLRASYGVTGNSRIGPYRSRGLYTISTGGTFATPQTPPNPFLSWERNYKSNIGLDLTIFNRFAMTLEYFNDNIRDQIVSRAIPAEIGFSSIQINGADMYNRGLEYSISAPIFQSPKFAWKTNFNISTLANKVTGLVGLGSQFSSSELARAQKIGTSTTAIWGINFAGIDPATGRELFTKNGELYDAATYRTLYNVNDWEMIGNSQPDFYGGLQNTFTIYGKLSVAVRGSFRYGDQTLLQDDLISKYTQIENRNLANNALDRWRQPGDLASHPIANATNPLFPNSSRFLYDASHIKLQNININYQFASKDLGLKGFKNISLFLDVSNVAYFYRQKSPEGRNGYAELRFTYPEARTLTFGTQINL